MSEKRNISGTENPNYKTGYCIKGVKNSLYNSWCNMKSRCLNKNHVKYHRYGGRGIKICDEWLDIVKFSQWALNNGWKQGYSIDRINNDGDYRPDNCRWVSVSENSRKKIYNKNRSYKSSRN